MVHILLTCDSAVAYLLAENAAKMKSETVLSLYVEFENCGTSKDTWIFQ